MAKPSAAILCIARGEQPYAREWLEYHLSLGFAHIYYIINDDDFNDAHNFYANLGFDERVSWHAFNETYTGWQLGAYCEFLNRFKEDWLMVMDLDEFLYFPDAGSVSDYLDSLDSNIGQVQFPWLNVPLHDYVAPSVLGALATAPKFCNHHVKSMARGNELVSIGVHRHIIKHAHTMLSSGEAVEANHYHTQPVHEPAFYQHHPCVLHASSRGQADMLNRICGHRFNNANCGDGEKDRLRRLLTGRPVWSALPNRYLLQKVTMSLPQVTLELKLPSLTHATDTRRLLKMFLGQINTMVDFQCDSWQQLEQDFEERYLLNYKLQRLNVEGYVDLELYLNCATQIEYALDLRQQLTARQHS